MLPPLSDSVVSPEIAAARQDSAEGPSSYSYDGCAYSARRAITA
jgi:hypothetical protein